MNNNHVRIDKSAVRIINELYRTANIYFQTEFKEYSIGHAQIVTLIVVSKKEGISQLQLSEYLNLDKSSITSQLKILENNGYITRNKSENDARMYQIYITDKTREILDPLKSIFISWTEILLDDFNEQDREKSLFFLEKMLDNVKKYNDKNK